MDVQLYRVLMTRLCIAWIHLFINSQFSEVGDSYVRDRQGKGFTTDVGYGLDFLDCLADYCLKFLEEEKDEKLS